MTSSRYPRPDQELHPELSTQRFLPLELHPAQALPIDFPSSLGIGVRATNVLLRMKLKSLADFYALDEKTLLNWRNCGKKTVSEIMEVVRRHKPSSEAIARTPDIMWLSSAQENTPVTYLRLSVRATNGLERLKISTVGQLARVSDQDLLDIQNFGRTSLREVHLKLAAFRSREFVIWPAEKQTAGELSRKITRAARKLQRLRNASAMLYDDPRFGHLIREMDLNVTNLREAADVILSRNNDPVNPKTLIRRLAEALKIVQTASRMTLEEELFSLTIGVGSERNRRIVVSYLGWDGTPPRTLEAVGQECNMTRERVRQICERVNTQRSSKPFLPVLDRVLRIVVTATPTLAEEIEKQLLQRRLTKGQFRIESVGSAANVFGREIRFTVESLHGHRFIVMSGDADLLNQIDHVARAAVSHWGVTTVDDVAAATVADPAFTRKVLVALPDFRWLDKSTGWFWVANVPRNALLTQIRKVLAVSPTINVGEMRTGVGRHHRRKGFAPPRRVLLELCRQLPWCQVTGDLIKAEPPLTPETTLSASEQIVFRTLKDNGPILPSEKFEELCLRVGLKRSYFFIHLSYSPIITKYAPGVYGLPGAAVPPGLVSSLIPKRRGKSSVMLDYGWAGDREIRILYKLSKAVVLNGIIGVPASIKQFLQGEFSLKTAAGVYIGTLVVKNNSAWGLGSYFLRRGGDPGDYLLVLLNLANRTAEIQLGDADLIDSLELSERQAIGFHWDAKGKSGRSSSWDARFQELVEFKNRHGHCNACWATDRPLGLWMTRQRSARRKGKLEADYVRRLDEIGFPWQPSRNYERDSWDNRFQQLVEYKDQHGHCDTPRATQRILWGWAVRQRRAKRIGKLDVDHIRRLEEIGFKWESARVSLRGGPGQQASWETRLQQLAEFKNQHGHCNVPRATDHQLGQWVSNQRYAKKIGKLDTDRVRKLEDIGFRWERAGRRTSA